MVRISDIKAAAGRLKGHIRWTPLLENMQLNEQSGGRIFIKPECLQITGSFKIRGAYNRISQLTLEEKKNGIVAFSSGNHAQGAALASKWLGVPATIVMPKTAPKLKMENTRSHGAEIVLYDPLTESREEIAAAIAREKGAIVVPSFDNPDILAGQGTIGLEIANDAAAIGIVIDTLAAPVSGGGLISGISIGLRESCPAAKIICVEPEGFDDTKRSLAAGERLSIEPGHHSICDALLTPSPGELTIKILQDVGAEGVTVTDDEVKKAIRFAAQNLKLVVEPGGAVALAAILAGKLDTQGKNTAIILSGGNIDLSMLSAITA